MSKSDLLKRTSFQAVLVGAFGGIAPKLIELIPQLFNNVFPSPGYILALTLLAIIGAVVVFVFKEDSLQKALVLGAGAPAILATLTANVVNPNHSGSISLLDVSCISAAQAQTPVPNDTINFVIHANASPYRLNAIWLRADSKTIQQYQQNGDTLTVRFPQETKEIRVDLPAEGTPFVMPASEIPKNKHVDLEITEDKNVHDFWKTFGNVTLPKYKIEKVERDKLSHK